MKAWELLEKGWCQEAAAKDKDGLPVEYYSEDAVAWCAQGAIATVYPTNAIYEQLIHRLYNHVGKNVSVWNDAGGRTQSEVVAVLKALDI